MTDAIPGGEFPLQAANRQPAIMVAGFIVALLLSLANSASAFNQYWVGPGGDTNSPASGTWTTLAVWSDGTPAFATAAWTNGNSAFFGGADNSAM